MSKQTITTPRISRAAERRAARPAFIDPDQLYEVNESCAALARSRGTFYKDVASGLIRVKKLGRRTRVLGSEIIRVANLDGPPTGAFAKPRGGQRASDGDNATP